MGKGLLACCLGALSCTAVMIGWLRSYCGFEHLSYRDHAHRVWCIENSPGAITVERTTPWCVQGERPDTWHHFVVPVSASSAYSRRTNFDATWRGGHKSITLPYWLLGATALLLGITGSALRRTPRPGVCTSCGYDLRASQGHCPECGRAFEKPAS